jgi:hypothetical protein
MPRPEVLGGQVTFAMVPTLARAGQSRRDAGARPPGDRRGASRGADSYRRIIDQALRAIPTCRIYGVTATPNRGDKRGCAPVFSNVADQIRIGELIASGHLVPPRTFVIDVGVQDELAKVRRTADDFDMSRGRCDHEPAPVTDAVIRHWREKAGEPPDRGVLLHRRSCRKRRPPSTPPASRRAVTRRDAGRGAQGRSPPMRRGDRASSSMSRC